MKKLLMTTIAIFGLATISMAQLPSYVPSSGLVGWWPFNGNAIDESDNNNNGTVNGATLSQDRFGNLNKAYSFDGITSYIEVLHNSSQNLNNSVSFSIWINPIDNNLNAQATRAPLGKRRTSTTSGLGFETLDNTGTCCGPQFYLNNNTGSGGLDYENATSLQLGIWTHLVGTYDGTTLKLYKNSILLGLSTGNISLTSTVQNLFFGTESSSSPNRYFKGLIDDIGFWNIALSQEEISNLYNAPNCSYNLSITPSTNQLETGSTANFIATTSDTFPSYVWQSDFGQGYVTLNNYGNYFGVNTNSLSISNVQLSEHNQPIRVISTSGECIDTSNVATINITDTCIVTINDTITTLISVTDTLIINTLITGLTPPNNLNIIKVFPNPANNHITIDFGNFASMNGYTLKITNSIGQIVFTTPINQQSSYVDLSTWSGNGIYFVQIIDTQNNTIENRKIVLQ